jgi:hypothetical protein
MEYKIRKTTGHCAKCEREIALGSEFFSLILLEQIEPARADYCVPCFEGSERDPAIEFAYWRTRRSGSGVAKRVIDFPTLRELFFKMTEQPGEEYRKLAYLLGLLLMRKKFLQLREFTSEGGRDYVVVASKDRPEPLKIEAPPLRAVEFAELRDRLRLLLDVEIEADGADPTASEESGEPRDD